MTTNGPKQTRDWIAAEVKRQLDPIAQAVEDVKKQNVSQSTNLKELQMKQNSLDKWRYALWGNGSGTPGYLEKAREEDKEQYSQILAVVTELRENVLREEGKEELRKEIEINRHEIEKVLDVKKTNKLTRLHYWIIILSTLGGGWVINLLHPLLKEFVSFLAQALK